MPLAALATNVIDNLTQRVREETVVPLASRRVEGTIERVLVHRLGVDDIRNTFNTIEALESCQEDLPRITLPTARGANHHKTVLNLLDLVELQDLASPAIALDETPLGAHLANLLAKRIQVDRDVVDAREDIGQKTKNQEGSSRDHTVHIYKHTSSIGGHHQRPASARWSR